MADFYRVVVRVPYRAYATPKGARVPRMLLFKQEVPVEIEVVRDPPVAVRCLAWTGTRQDLIGHRGALWLPFGHDAERGPSPGQAEATLQAMADGEYTGNHGCSLANPFALIGLERNPPNLTVHDQGAIESAALRSVDWTDADEMAVAAQRVARDILLTADGRLLRRSPGPTWQCFENRLYAALGSFQHPIPHSQHFGCLRREESGAWWAQVSGMSRVAAVGEIEVALPGFVEDHDALLAARTVLRADYAAWVGQVAAVASPAVLELAARVDEGYRLVHGLAREAYAIAGDGRTPVDAVAPSPADCLAAVDDLRLFVADMPGTTEDRIMPTVCRDWRNVFDMGSALALHRFDEMERPRITVAETESDRGLVPSISL